MNFWRWATINWVPTRQNLTRQKSRSHGGNGLGLPNWSCFRSHTETRNERKIDERENFEFKNNHLSVSILSIAIKSQTDDMHEIVSYLLGCSIINLTHIYILKQENGANPNLPDQNGNCALHVASHVLKNPSNILFELIAHGANTNQLDCFGNSCLHIILLNNYHGCSAACSKEKLGNGPFSSILIPVVIDFDSQG